MALAFAALLTPAAFAAFVLALWRLGADLGYLGAFAFQDGLLSRWQVWFAIALAVQLAVIYLTRYGSNESPAHVSAEPRRAHTPPPSSRRAS
ncbi:MAG: hypothetical protein SFV54_28155 [Bryobacteraceae bacterium]|nr:hypothetical protein [Bryobacteraceae bacterium]